MALTAGCGENGESNPPSSPPPSSGGETITGRERFGWTQTVASPGDLPLYRYALYVDGTRHVIEGETCAATGVETAFDCSAPLPMMTPGRHTLELAAFVDAAGTVQESSRTAALQVNVAAVVAPADIEAPDSASLVSSDGVTFQVDVLARDLNDPVDLAASPDGRIFVAERGGRLRVFDPRSAAATGDRAENVLPLIAARDVDAALASIALAPDFASTGEIYVAFLAGSSREGVLRVARLRETAGLFGQAAIVASHEVPPDASALARFGPDGTLYLGVGTGSESDSAQQLARASGKVLRLTREGTAPDDNPWRSPVLSVGHRDPRGLAWDPATGTVWEVEQEELNAVRAGANYGWPVANGSQRHPQVTSPALLLPPGTEPSGVVMVGAEASPLFGSLIVSALGAEDLLRVRFDQSGRPQVTGRLLQGRFGRIGQVAVSSDGALHAITANGDTHGQGNDILIRLAPPGR
jgi:glucose/arabinose dehydrogenase